MTNRSARPEVRNPFLALPSVRRLAELPADVRALLADILMEASADARERGDKLWAKSKPPMAAYWRAKATDARHLAMAVRRAQAPTEPKERSCP